MFARKPVSNRTVLYAIVPAALLATTLGLTAVAQPGRGGRSDIPPEMRAKVQAAQARSVAADLKLDVDKAAKLEAAFVAFQKAAATNRPEGGGRGDWEAMRTGQQEQQAKLADDLKAFLEEKQATDTAKVLGGFNRGWDRMVQIILGFELEDAKEGEALGHTLAYLKAGAKAREEGAGDRDAMRTAFAAAKKALDDRLAPLLNDTQNTEWKSKTTRRSRSGDRDRGSRGNRRGDATR